MCGTPGSGSICMTPPGAASLQRRVRDCWLAVTRMPPIACFRISRPSASKLCPRGVGGEGAKERGPPGCRHSSRAALRPPAAVAGCSVLVPTGTPTRHPKDDVLEDDPLSQANLQQIRNRYRPLEERRRRAADRLASMPPAGWCFALVGVSTEDGAPLQIGGIATIRAVTEPPGEVGLATALRDKSIFGAIGRWMPLVQYELALADEFASESPNFILDVGWTVISGLRLRTGCEFLVPAVSDHSWSTIEGALPDSCLAQLLEDYPNAFRLDPNAVMTEAGGSWVASRFLELLELRANSRFHFSLECLSGSYGETDGRMAASKLWAGVEALADVDQELRFRLSALLASLIEPPGRDRATRYKNITKLYGVRSKVVHGGLVSDEVIREHVGATRSLLASCLIAVVELGRLPARDELELNLLGVALEPHRVGGTSQ